MTDPIAFSAATPRHALPLLFAGQAQKEFFVNEALARLDLLLHPLVESESANPPASPAIGQCWLVGPNPTGAWLGRAGCLAGWDGDWIFVEPREGMSVRFRTSGRTAYFSGTWATPSAPQMPTGGSVIDTQARDTLATLIGLLRSCGIFSA